MQNEHDEGIYHAAPPRRDDIPKAHYGAASSQTQRRGGRSRPRDGMAGRPEARSRLHNDDELAASLERAYQRLHAGDVAGAQHILEQVLSAGAMRSIGGGDARTAAPGQLLDPCEPVVPADCPGALGTEGGDARVMIRTLGTFEVLVDGTRPGSRRKPAYRPLGMLKVLIAQGGCAVSQGVILDALWPDSEGDRGHDAYQVALHRLRKILGSTDSITLGHGRMFIDDQQVWVDAFVLESLCRSAQAGDIQRRAALALDLYRGSFLPQDEDAPWSMRMRECLRAKFVNLIARAAVEREASKDFLGAAALFERGMAVDDMDHLLKNGMVRCLTKAGRAPVSRTRR